MREMVEVAWAHGARVTFSLEPKPIHCRLTVETDKAEPIIIGLLARVLIEHGAEVTGLWPHSVIPAKLPNLTGLNITMGPGNYSAKSMNTGQKPKAVVKKKKK